MPRRYSGFTSTSNRASTTSKSPTRPPSSLMRCANGLHRTRRHGTIARLVASGNARIEQAAHDHWRRVHAPLFHDELGVRALARSRRAAQKQQLRRHIHSAAAVRVAGLYLAPHGIKQGLWAAHIGAVQPPPREGCDGEVFVGHAGEQGRELFKIDLAWGGPRDAGRACKRVRAEHSTATRPPTHRNCRGRPLESFDLAARRKWSHQGARLGLPAKRTPHRSSTAPDGCKQ